MNGQKILEEREARNLSVREVAIKTGLTEQTIREIEKGRNKNPTIHTVMSLCNFYGISLLDVMD